MDDRKWVVNNEEIPRAVPVNTFGWKWIFQIMRSRDWWKKNDENTVDVPKPVPSQPVAAVMPGSK